MTIQPRRGPAMAEPIDLTPEPSTVTVNFHMASSPVGKDGDAK